MDTYVVIEAIISLNSAPDSIKSLYASTACRWREMSEIGGWTKPLGCDSAGGTWLRQELPVIGHRSPVTGHRRVLPSTSREQPLPRPPHIYTPPAPSLLASLSDSLLPAFSPPVPASAASLPTFSTLTSPAPPGSSATTFMTRPR